MVNAESVASGLQLNPADAAFPLSPEREIRKEKEK